MRRPRIAFAAVALAPAALGAQDAIVPARADVLTPYSAYARTAWSALSPLADLARPGPRAPLVPSLFAVDAPMPVGLLSAGGVPSLLARDSVRDEWGIAMGSASMNGGYRRPLDPGHATAGRVDGWGTSRLGGRAVATGLLALDRRRLTDDTRLATAAPYAGASLLVPTDTASPELTRSGTRLEGAIATRTLGVDVGLAVGYDALSANTQRSQRARLARRAVTGGTLSAGRALIGRALVAAAWVRAQDGVETLTHLGNPGTGRVLVLQGYAEPEPIDYSPALTYFRRIARRATGGGVGAMGTLGGTRWAAFWERGTAREEHSSARRNDPPFDAWDASGTTVGAAVQRGFGASGVGADEAPVTLTLHARNASLDGDARRADLTGIIAFSSDQAFASGAELRWRPREARWAAVALGDLTRRTRDVYDAVAENGSRLTAWTTGGAFELRRDVGARGAVSVGYGASRYVTSALMPRMSDSAPTFHALVVPELEYAATPALAQRGAVGVRWRRADGSAIVFSGTLERVGGQGALASLPTAPKGERTAVALVIALVR